MIYNRFFPEAVINVDKYSTLLERVTETIYRDLKGKSLNRVSMIRYFNKLFKKFKIEFKIVKEEQVIKNNVYKIGLIGAETLLDKYSTIKIYCNMNIFDITTNEEACKLFIKFLIRLIKHELIHRVQVINILDLKIKKSLATNKKDQIEYYKNIHELMAYAWEILEELRFSGLTDKQIEHKLKKLDFTANHSGILFHYVKMFDNNREVLHKLYKYIYMYIHEQFSNAN